MAFMVGTLPATRLLRVWAFDKPADYLGPKKAMEAFAKRTPVDDA